MSKPPEQDNDLFRQVLQDVTPLKPSGRIAPVRAPLKYPQPLQNHTASAIDNLSDHGAPDTPVNEFLCNGLNRMTLRQLRRGKWPIQDQLDLHGLDSEMARKLLGEFLLDAAQRDLRCINIIHGKGWRSDGREGILKTLTRHWLTQHPQVLAFCEAPQNAGGGGAVWVLLKQITAR